MENRLATDKNFPAVPATYSIWHQQEEEVCIYVGATKNLRDRLRKLHSAHPDWFKETNRVKWELCNIADLMQAEMRLIVELQPIANKCLQGYQGGR